MKNKGVFSLENETPNVKREIERKFSKSAPKLAKFGGFVGVGSGFQKVAIFLL